jgi:hypothetical protein
LTGQSLEGTGFDRTQEFAAHICGGESAEKESGITPLGAATILRQDPFSRPQKSKRSSAPRVHAVSKLVRKRCMTPTRGSSPASEKRRRRSEGAKLPCFRGVAAAGATGEAGCGPVQGMQPQRRLDLLPQKWHPRDEKGRDA